MYCCNGVVVAVNATMTNDHYANSKPNSILIRKIKYYSVTVTSSQSQHANVILQCQLLSHCDILYTDFRNNSQSSVSSVIRHLRAGRICAAALNSRSTAAELGRVALFFGKKRNTWQTSNK